MDNRRYVFGDHKRTFVLGTHGIFDPLLILMLLIDTGDVADPNHMPLAKTVMNFLQPTAIESFPCLWSIRTGTLTIVRATSSSRSYPTFRDVTLNSIRRFYNFTDWPKSLAQIDLGDRIVDVILTPGHDETEVSFYDRNTAIFFFSLATTGPSLPAPSTSKGGQQLQWFLEPVS